jgi:hypothetical protein
MSNVILQVDNLKQYFRIDRKTTIRAVDNVSFKVYEGRFSVWLVNPDPVNQRWEDRSFGL